MLLVTWTVNAFHAQASMSLVGPCVCGCTCAFLHCHGHHMISFYSKAVPNNETEPLVDCPNSEEVGKRFGFMSQLTPSILSSLTGTNKILLGCHSINIALYSCSCIHQLPFKNRLSVLFLKEHAPWQYCWSSTGEGQTHYTERKGEYGRQCTCHMLRRHDIREVCLALLPSCRGLNAVDVQ